MIAFRMDDKPGLEGVSKNRADGTPERNQPRHAQVHRPLAIVGQRTRCGGADDHRKAASHSDLVGNAEENVHEGHSYKTAPHTKESRQRPDDETKRRETHPEWPARQSGLEGGVHEGSEFRQIHDAPPGPADRLISSRTIKERIPKNIGTRTKSAVARSRMARL